MSEIRKPHVKGSIHTVGVICAQIKTEGIRKPVLVQGQVFCSLCQVDLNHDRPELGGHDHDPKCRDSKNLLLG